MYERLLFPTDGSEPAAAVYEHALDVAERHGATLHLLNVADTTRDSVVRIRSEVVDALVREGERIVAEAEERAGERDVPVVADVRQGTPHETIVGYADEYDIDLVVLPTHGRQGLGRFLLGSVTERVVRLSDVPVLTVRPDGEVQYPFRTVLVPTDGSEPAAAALGAAIDVANAYGAALHLLSVIDVTSLGVDVHSALQTDVMEDDANAVVDEAAEAAEAASVGSVARTVEYGSSIHREILSYVDGNDVDLVVVGTHGRTGFDRYLLGSVTEKLVRTSPVPVMTVREPDSGA